jgi:oxaloacetate decarboxylase alpha subunit/pyruvate carboxylase subunit B
VRKDLGQIPLVTPTSQIVGIQTVNNVLFDDEKERYKMITDQVKDLCYGLYGKTAVPINPELQKKALKGYARGEEPITCRPAEVLEPELEKAKKEVKGLSADIDDVITYALFPVTGKKFLNWKYGKETPADEVKPKTLEDVKREQDLIHKAKMGLLVEKPKKEVPEKTGNIRKFNVFVDGDYFEVEVDDIGGPPVVTYSRPAVAAPPKAAAPAPKPAAPAPSKPAAPPKMEQPKASAPKAPEKEKAMDGTLLRAPMPGMIVKYLKNVGDTVSEGETVVILEAMKMENALHAPVSGTIKSINFKGGDSVAKNDILCVIG